jgi:hypothetical protein
MNGEVRVKEVRQADTVRLGSKPGFGDIGVEFPREFVNLD